jgi:transposase
LRTGIPWRLLPTRQLGCGSPVTCWRRLRDWQRAGVWQRVHHQLLEQLGREGRLDWSRASLELHLDKAYDYPRCRRALRARGITPRTARRGVESSQRLGRHHYVASGRWRGWWATGDCRSATSDAPTS